MKTFYVTTPIYYVNDVPHIGHAYTTVCADVLARFHRLQGEAVFFLTGTDEHGQKIAQKAAEQGMEPQAYADMIVGKFKELFEKLTISNDDFIRTTEERHIQACQAFWKRVQEKGDIYKAKYEGLYCTGCESFKDEKDLVDGKCPDHNKAPEWLVEEDYFFAWSKYQKQLEELFHEHKDFVEPKARYNEMLAFLERGIQDIPISRSLISWGIPVPDDPDHVIYVWFDALINYLTGIGWENPEKKELYNSFWPANVHLMAKDILSKHALLWPAMLLSASISLPKKCFSHGFFTKDGMKISKSIGNVIDPHQLIDTYGVDAFRYFFLREWTFGEDGDYREERFAIRYNNDLANDLGNLVSRVVAMLGKYTDGKVPVSTTLDQQFEKRTTKVWAAWESSLERLAFKEALESIWELITFANVYVDEQKPWVLAKAEDKIPIYNALASLVEIIRHIGLLLTPFIPESSEKILTAIGSDALPLVLAPTDKAWGTSLQGKLTTLPGVLFPKHQP